MATEQETAEVKAFLDAHDGEWTDPDRHHAELASLLHRRQDDSDPIAYHVNSVVAEAGLEGGVEEHGSGDWFVSNGTARDGDEDDDDE
jgi:hypothetical protein